MNPAPDPRTAGASGSTWRPVGDLIRDILRRAAGTDPARLAMIAALLDGSGK